MVIKGYLVFNVTQEKDKFFSTQINSFINAFKKEHVILTPVSNLKAYEKIKKDKKAKFVLFWDKDIALMYQIESLGIKTFNNVDAIRICDDKAYTYGRLLKNNVLTPKTYVLPLTFSKDVNLYFNDIKELIRSNKIKYPLVVKERRSSLGLGVYLIKDETQLKTIIKKKWQSELLIQQYIGFLYGLDYRVYVINHRPKISVIRENKNDFRSNLEQGGKMRLNENPDADLLRTAIKASLAVNLDFGAIDLVKDKNNKYYVLEVNSNARTATIDKLFDIDLTRAVAKYIIENI